MEKGNNRATNREKAHQIAYHDKTYKLDTEQTAVTTIIMKPPGQNRVTTMKETLTLARLKGGWAGGGTGNGKQQQENWYMTTM